MKSLRRLFESEVAFRLTDGTAIDGAVFIGSTEFVAVEVIKAFEAAYEQEFSIWLNEEYLPRHADRREQLLLVHANRARFSELLTAVRKDQVVPLVGSGMCVPSGLRTWADFMRIIKDYSVVDKAKLEEVLASGEFELAADLLLSSMAPKLFRERIDQELTVEDEDIAGPILLLPDIFPNLAVTLNLDDVMENVYAWCSREFEVIMVGREIASYRQRRTRTERFLLKLHGDRKDPSSHVLTTFEYDAAYGPRGVTREELSWFYRSHHMLFLGCGLANDRCVQILREIAKVDPNMPKHYAFLPMPETNELRLQRENTLADSGIFPIWYDGAHDEDIEALLLGLMRE